MHQRKVTHPALAAPIRVQYLEKGFAVPLFLPTVFGEEKGSVDIKEGKSGIPRRAPEKDSKKLGKAIVSLQ